MQPRARLVASTWAELEQGSLQRLLKFCKDQRGSSAGGCYVNATCYKKPYVQTTGLGAPVTIDLDSSCGEWQLSKTAWRKLHKRQETEEWDRYLEEYIVPVFQRQLTTGEVTLQSDNKDLLISFFVMFALRGVDKITVLHKGKILVVQ